MQLKRMTEMTHKSKLMTTNLRKMMQPMQSMQTVVKQTMMTKKRKALKQPMQKKTIVEKLPATRKPQMVRK